MQEVCPCGWCDGVKNRRLLPDGEGERVSRRSGGGHLDGLSEEVVLLVWGRSETAALSLLNEKMSG